MLPVRNHELEVAYVKEFDTLIIWAVSLLILQFFKHFYQDTVAWYRKYTFFLPISFIDFGQCKFFVLISFCTGIFL